MAVEAEVLPPVQDIVAAVIAQPEIALLNKEKQREFLAAVRAASIVETPDTASAKGREDIRKRASRVTKSKTALDASRKAMTEDLRKQVAEINSSANALIDDLDALAKEVRRPLTEWEEAEVRRERKSAEILAWLRNSAIVTIEDTSATVRRRGREVYEFAVDPAVHLKFTADVQQAKDHAVATLRAALARLIQQEDEQAELQRLREEREAREEEERQARAAQEAEERKAAQERAAQEREAQIARQAEQRAAQAEREAAQREIDAANARAAQAEAERKRLADAEAERAAQAERERVETARLERSRKHRAAVIEKVAHGIVRVAAPMGVHIEIALAIARAAARDEIPALKVDFSNVL